MNLDDKLAEKAAEVSEVMASAAVSAFHTLMAIANDSDVDTAQRIEVSCTILDYTFDRFRAASREDEIASEQGADSESDGE